MSTSARSGSTPLHLASFITLGCSVTLLGPSLKTFQDRADVNIAAIGLLFAVSSIGYLLGSLTTGKLLQQQLVHRVLALGLVFVAAGLLLFCVASSFLSLMVAAAIVGFGGSMTDVTGNSLVLWVHKGGPVMNALHLCFGIGAMLAPLIVSQSLVLTGRLTVGYVVVAGACLLMAGIIASRPSPANPHEEGARGFPKGVTKLVVLAVGFFVAYAWLELGFASWIFTYARELGLDEKRGAAWLTTGFWAAFSFGRLIGIPISAVVTPKVVMIGDFVITGIGLFVLIAGGDNRVAMWTGTILVGVGVASMFPCMLSLSEPVIPSTSAVTSLFLVGASVGSTVIPPAIGGLIEQRGASAMPVVVLAGTVVCAAIVIGFVRSSRSQ